MDREYGAGIQFFFPYFIFSPEQQKQMQSELNEGQGIVNLGDEVESPPVFTDTSLSTPALGGSRVGTPKDTEQLLPSGKRSQKFNDRSSGKKLKFSA